jgi:hypothetical protein
MPANSELLRSPPQIPQESQTQDQYNTLYICDHPSSAKNLDDLIEDEQLNSDLVKQKKTCSSDYINVETEIGAVKKIPEKPKKRDTRTAMFLEALNQGGAENNDTGFDETKDEKNRRTAMFLEVLDQGGAENSAKHCQTLPTSGSKTTTSGNKTTTSSSKIATSGSKTALSAKQLRDCANIAEHLTEIQVSDDPERRHVYTTAGDS